MGCTSLRHTPPAHHQLRGFTLIELVVVTGIIVVVSSLMLANQASFGGAITTRNLAYDIGLSVREAQTYGISVRQFAGTFGSGYGVHFRDASPTSFILFADATGANGLYDGQEEIVDSTTIGRGYHIANLCVTPAGASEEICGVERIDILFERPEPDAQIRYNGGTGLNQRARIVVASPQDDEVSVIVEATGQISVP